MKIETLLYDVILKPNSVVEFDTKEMAFIYLISGKVRIGDNEIATRSVVTFELEGNKVLISTTEQAANFMLASGSPHHEPIIYGGPFVMTTQDQSAETLSRLASGQMGILRPL